MQACRCLHVDEPSSDSNCASNSAGDAQRNTLDSPMLTTSDYYTESHNRKDHMPPIDITTNASPLLDFGKKEKEYISKVIQITCQRTTLLRKNKHATSSHAPNPALNLLRKGNSMSKGTASIILSQFSNSNVNNSNELLICTVLIFGQHCDDFSILNLKSSFEFLFEILILKFGDFSEFY